MKISSYKTTMGRKMISVIIPVFNVEDYLQSGIDSLLAQTFEDIEYIFINDASTDDSLGILRSNQNRDPIRIRIIDLPNHVNLGGVRNIGFNASKGDYIGFVDSDDMILPNMFQMLFDSIIRTEADVAFIMHARIGKDTRYSDITDDMLGCLSPGIIWDTSMIKMEGKELSDSDRCDLHAFQIGGLWSGLWRKSVITDNEIKWPIPRYEDNYWGSLILCYIRKISFVNEIGYLYRDNPESITNKRNQEYVLDRITIEKLLLQDVKNRQLFYKYFVAWEFIYISRYALNTFLQIEKNWDVIPYKQLSDVSRDVLREFPDWRKNKYYREHFSLMKKLLVCCTVYFPEVTAFLYKPIANLRRKT